MTTNPKIQNNFKRIILFSSLNGGTGKSFIAKLCAIEFAKKNKVGLIDIDINSLGLTNQLNLFGKKIESKTDSHGNTLVFPINCYEFKFISAGLLDIGSVLTGVRSGMLSSISRLLINDVCWGEIDYLLIDTPSGLSDIELTLLDDFPNIDIVFISNGNMFADNRKLQYYLNRKVNIAGLLYNKQISIIDLEQEYITFCKNLNISFLKWKI